MARTSEFIMKDVSQYQRREYNLSVHVVCCSSCFGEKYISQYIRDNGSFGRCSYCRDSLGRKIRAKTMDVEQLYDYLIECVKLHYDEPHPDFLPRDSDTGDFMEDGESFGDILYELGANCNHQDLIEELERYSPISLAHLNSWVPTEGEYNRDRWNEFKDRIQENVDAFGTASMDLHVESIVDRLSLIVPIKKIPPCRTIFRLRPILPGDDFPFNAQSLGSHPSPINPNRFTPIGASAFYGSFDLDTALSETRRADAVSYVVGEWVSNQPLFVADFSKIPKYGGPFDARTNRLHEVVGFIRAFIEEISEPIDSRDDPDMYVPTQFFYASILQRLSKRPVHGFSYRSSKHPDGECIVLNIDSQSCVSRFNRNDTVLQLRLRRHLVHRTLPG